MSNDRKARRRIRKHNEGVMEAGLTSGEVGEGESVLEMNRDIALADRAQNEGWKTSQETKDKVKRYREKVVDIAGKHADEVIREERLPNPKILSLGLRAGDSAMKGDQGAGGGDVKIDINTEEAKVIFYIPDNGRGDSNYE